MPQPLSALRVIPLDGTGPEDVFVLDGKIITGLDDGRIIRVDTDREGAGGARVDVLADTGGRPLGIESLRDGRLLVCDAYRGLLAVDPGGGAPQVLVGEYRGRPLGFCNNAAVGSDGTIYFSDSSRHFGLGDWRGELIQNTLTGRLLRRTPAGRVELLADRLQFANGVALPPDESYVAVAETGGYRITRVWLTGERAGHRDVLAELPGFPDNLSTGSDGLIWIAVANPRDRVLDLVLRTPPAVRRLVRGTPHWMQPAPKRSLRAMAIDPTGQVVRDLTGPEERFHFVTGVREQRGRLYLGSLLERGIVVAEVPDRALATAPPPAA